MQVDTEGRIASDSFYVTYHGEPLNQSMVQLVTNALQVSYACSQCSACCRQTLHEQLDLHVIFVDFRCLKKPPLPAVPALQLLISPKDCALSSRSMPLQYYLSLNDVEREESY